MFVFFKKTRLKVLSVVRNVLAPASFLHTFCRQVSRTHGFRVGGLARFSNRRPTRPLRRRVRVLGLPHPRKDRGRCSYAAEEPLCSEQSALWIPRRLSAASLRDQATKTSPTQQRSPTYGEHLDDWCILEHQVSFTLNFCKRFVDVARAPRARSSILRCPMLPICYRSTRSACPLPLVKFVDNHCRCR